MADEPQPRISFLLDAPTVARDGTIGRKLQIAKVAADLSDPRYGKFEITADEVERWAKNLAKLPGGIALIDFDHAADKPGPARRTEAAGWMTAIRLDGGIPVADVEWTPAGESAIRDRRYLFFSPTYGPYSDETGAVHEDTCIGGALTNRPFLNMPVISLASAPTVLDGPWHPGAYQLDADATLRPSDSRRQMETAEIKRLAKALGLAEDATEAKVLEAIAALKAEPAGPDVRKLAKALGVDETADETKLLDAIADLRKAPEPDPAGTPDAKTLEQQATAAGFVMLTKAQADSLNAAATEVPALKQTLKELTDARVEETWKREWNAAVDDLRVAPAEEEPIRELYDANPEATLKMLAARPKIVNDRRRSSGKGDRVAPDGVDPEQWELDQRVQAYMLEHPGTDYIKALGAVEGHSAFGAAA
jgi:phage I-like protein